MNKKLFALLAVPLFGFACAPSTVSDTNTASAPAAMSQNSMSTDAMDHSKMDHSKMNHDGMSHSAMQSAPNAASAPYDLQYLDTMVAHHQSAVDMAKMIDDRTQNAELRKFGAQVVASQSKEIAQMKEWREKWFAGKPSALNMEMAGMADSMKMDMSKLAAAKDKAFDLAFVEMMIPHHYGAVVMSQDALKKAEHPEIKTLSNQIIREQDAEIKTMDGWKTAWAK